MIHLIEFRAMGCQISVQIEANQQGSDILRHIPDQIMAIETQLTRFDADSELMRFNACSGEYVAVSEVLFENIRAAKHAALLTDGLYNPLVLPALIATGYDLSFEQISVPNVSVPSLIPDWHEIRIDRYTQEVCIPAGSAVDLGGMAKGWTAVRIADELAQVGACLVNIGGDMVGRGEPEGLPGWPVEIEDPLSGASFTTVYLHNTSIATSGTDYRHWHDNHGGEHHHIIDPYTGRSAVTDLLSVTVIHPNATYAEAYTKAVLLRGASDGLYWLNQQWQAAGLVFQHDGTVLGTSTFTTLINQRNT